MHEFGRFCTEKLGELPTSYSAAKALILLYEAHMLGMKKSPGKIRAAQGDLDLAVSLRRNGQSAQAEEPGQLEAPPQRPKLVAPKQPTVV